MTNYNQKQKTVIEQKQSEYGAGNVSVWVFSHAFALLDASLPLLSDYGYYGGHGLVATIEQDVRCIQQIDDVLRVFEPSM